MCRISNVVRINGRYVYRCRIHYRKIVSKPPGLALKTADPKVARHRAAFLSARFARVKGVVDAMLENGRTLTGSEIEALFRRQLETELQFYVHSAYENASWSSAVPEVAAQEAEAMRLLRRPDRHLGMTDADRDELRKRGLEADIPVIEDYMRQARKTLSDDAVTHQILATGAPAHARNVAAARTHLFRALASASARAQCVFDNEIMDAPDPVRALLQNLGGPSAEVARMLGHTTGPISPPRLPEERRDHKTINRELSTMAIVAKHLATTSWHPRVPNATVLNFGAARIATKNGADFDTRPPWTTAHLEMLFNSPIYIGNGGTLRRLRASDDNGSIWHDAAYFAPLLWLYHHTCREETCAQDHSERL